VILANLPIYSFVVLQSVTYVMLVEVKNHHPKQNRTCSEICTVIF